MNPLVCDFCGIKPAEFTIPQSGNADNFPNGVARICYSCKCNLEKYGQSRGVKFYSTFDTASVERNLVLPSSLGKVGRTYEGAREKVKAGISNSLGSRRVYEVDIETKLAVESLFKDE